MYFTQEDYKKIENWLHRNSVKDTEFQEALPFTGKEIVTVVQDGHNRKVNIQEFINQLYKHGVEDFLNVTNTYRANNITLKEAIRLIPAEARKEGQVITFLNTDGNWEIYQFIGKLNQWNNSTLWNNPFDWEKFVVDSILPDEEDLTKSASDAKGNAYLSLKNRKYEPDKYSGLGRKILRRRVVEIEDPIYGTQEKNLLLQADFTEDNTVYVVRYDFTLNGQDITLPDNSYIEYEGGSISDGNIIDRAGGLNRVILKKNIVNGKNILAQEMVSTPNTIYEIRYDFTLSENVTIPANCVLEFDGGSISAGSGSNMDTITFNNTSVFGKGGINCSLLGTLNSTVAKASWCKEINSANIQALLNLKPNVLEFDINQTISISVDIKDNIVIDGRNCKFIPLHIETSYDYNLPYHVFYVNGAYNVTIQNCRFEDIVHHVDAPSNTGSEPIIFASNANFLLVKNCIFKDIEGAHDTLPVWYSDKIWNYGIDTGLLIQCADVIQTTIEGCEITGNCSGAEMIAVKATNYGNREQVNFDMINCYIHNVTPIYGSLTDIVANHIKFNNNRVESFNLNGTLANLFGLEVEVNDNIITNCRVGSVFDTCEYVYFDSNNVSICNNYVEAKNSLMIETVTKNLIVRDNIFKGFSFIGSYNDSSSTSPYDDSNPDQSSYKWFYRKTALIPKNQNVIIEGNKIDCTNYGQDSIVTTIAIANTAINAIRVSAKFYKGGIITIRNNDILFDSVLRENINSVVTITTYRPPIYINNMMSIIIRENCIKGFDNASYYKYPIRLTTSNALLNVGEKIISIDDICISNNKLLGYGSLGWDQCAVFDINADTPVTVKTATLTFNSSELDVIFRRNAYNIVVQYLDTNMPIVENMAILVSNIPKYSKEYNPNYKNTIIRNGLEAIAVNSSPVETPNQISSGTSVNIGNTIRVNDKYYLVMKPFRYIDSLVITNISGTNMSKVTIESNEYGLYNFASPKNMIYKGYLTSRPANLKGIDIGFPVFENNKMIYWTNDTSGGKTGWVDTTGADV